MLQVNQLHRVWGVLFCFEIFFWNVSSLSPQVFSTDQTNWKSHLKKKIKQCFLQCLTTSLRWSTSIQLAHANVLHIFLSTPKVYQPQSLVSSNMSHLDLRGFSLLRGPFLKVVWLAKRTPSLHKTKGHGFPYLSQLMKTISLQPTLIKRG